MVVVGVLVADADDAEPLRVQRPRSLVLPSLELRFDFDVEFESDAELFFNRTLMTQGLREALSILRDSLTGDDPRGTHILYGPYGSGKSHQMVALYHCFDDPTAAGAWAGDSIEGFEDALPESATPITVAMQNEYL